MRLPRALSLIAAVSFAGGSATALADAAASAASPASPAPSSRCDQFGETAIAGSVASDEIDELSGMGASRTLPGILWAHNDSGDGPRLFAMDEAGADLGTYEVVDPSGTLLTATDWEDLAVVTDPADGAGRIYIADIGDNAAARSDGVTIHRVAEPATAPDGTGGALVADASLLVHYPDGPTDAESLLVDPVDGTVVIVTKDVFGSSLVLTVPAGAWVAGATTSVDATRAGTVSIGVAELAAVGALGDAIPGTLVTAGDVAPDGSWAVLRTYQAIVAVDRAAGTTLADALLGEHCVVALTTQPQAESISITADGTGVLTATEVQGAVGDGRLDEGSTSPIERTPVAPATTTALETTTPGTTATPDTLAPDATGRQATASTQTLGTAEVDVAGTTTTVADTPTTLAAGQSEGSDDRSAAYVVAAIGAVVAAGVIAFALRQSAKRGSED